MSFADVILLASIFGGFLMAFALGANDVANSMAPSVGAKAITLRQAVIVAGVLNFIGAVLLGSHVAATISKGIIDASAIHDQNVLMLGMFAALLSSGLWVLVATFTALPVSSTHSIVGSLVGFGLVAGGPDVVYWGSMTRIVISWISSPFIGALIAYLAFIHIQRMILYRENSIRALFAWAPFWACLTLLLISLSFCFKTPIGKKMELGLVGGLVVAGAFSLVLTVIFYTWLRRFVNRQTGHPTTVVEEVFKRMQVGTACYVALSQGANDVANAIGPVIAIYFIAETGGLIDSMQVPLWILILGGAGITVGIIAMGHKVMNTVGERITKMNNTRGFAVDFSAATTVLMASNMGLPVSTTHATVGAVVGVGLARGFSSVDFRVLLRILLYWVLTVPIAAFSCIVIFQILRWTFL